MDRMSFGDCGYASKRKRTGRATFPAEMEQVISSPTLSGYLFSRATSLRKWTRHGLKYFSEALLASVLLSDGHCSRGEFLIDVADWKHTVINHKSKIHSHIQAIANEMLAFVRSSESSQGGRWVAAIHIKDALQLNFVATPQQGPQYGTKGWLFAILARILEDQGRLEYKKIGNRAFYRSIPDS